jgi:hypothetical protein
VWHPKLRGLPMPSENRMCRASGADALQEVPGFANRPRVTSDCRPSREGGNLLRWGDCSVPQAVPDQQWFGEIGEIYCHYDIYHQPGAEERHVFDRTTGNMRLRSEVLLEKPASLPETPLGGTLLDVGCGMHV